ncbi:MAG TPA: hypothetical protein VGK44_04345 [Casimicrobiaceae bacterium]
MNRQMPLAATIIQDHAVVIPDLRGTGLSSFCSRIDAYRYRLVPRSRVACGVTSARPSLRRVAALAWWKFG